MGRFDKIQETPDFWTSALNSFGENYDRLIQAEEMNKQDERYNQQQSIANERYNQQQLISNQERIKEEQRYNEQTFTERKRYNEQQKLAKQEKDREEWQYMFEQAKPTQKSLIYKNGLNNNISGLTGAGLEALQNSEAVDATLNTQMQDFFTGDAEYKHSVGAALASNLIANKQNDEAARVTSELKETRSQIENKEVFDILSGQFANLIEPGVKGLLSNMGDLSDRQLEAVMVTITQKSDDIDSQRKLAQKLIEIGSDELQTPATQRAFTMGTLLLEKISGKDIEDEETKETKSLSLKGFDEDLVGSFDELPEERKQKIFNAVASKYKDEYESDPIIIGKKIIDEINKTNYDLTPQVSGFSASITDPEYEGIESLKEEEINNRIQKLYNKKGFTTEARLAMMREKDKKEIRETAINQLLSERRRESIKKSKKVSREMSKEEAQRKLEEEIMFGGQGF